jgi:hypothetical protein
MGKGIMIIGESGTGKSTSMESLNPEETFIINVKNKSLPFRGWKTKYQKFNSTTKEGNHAVTDQAAQVLALLNFINKELPKVKTVVIDDFQYIAASEFMAKASEKGFDKFTSIGKNIYTTADAPSKLRDDLNVVYLCHPEESTDVSGNKRVKAKTVGKLVDNVVTLEGLFTIVLYTEVVKEKGTMNYSFITQNDGTNTAKSPRGMFDTFRIPNDLKFVLDAVNSYDI